MALRATKYTVSKTWKTSGTMVVLVLDRGLLSFCFHRNNEAGQTYRSEGWRQSFPSSSQLLSPFPFTCTRGRRSLRSIVIRIFHTPTRSVSHTHTHIHYSNYMMPRRLFPPFTSVVRCFCVEGCATFPLRRTYITSSPFGYGSMNISNCLREFFFFYSFPM